VLLGTAAITCITVFCTSMAFRTRWMDMPITCNYAACPTVRCFALYTLGLT
jgi:hypothetical protein